MKLSTIFVVLGLFVELSFTLTCYRCQNREECSLDKEELEEKECPDENVTMCMQKIETKGADAGQVVRRDCAYGNPSGEDVRTRYCYVRRHSSKEMCVCHQNLCNGVLPPCSIRRFGEDGQQGKGKGCIE